MDPIEQFNEETRAEIAAMGRDDAMRQQSLEWMLATAKHKYTYHFSWMGIPIIQFPQDMVALQEVIWKTQPDLIIETGIAHGGSLAFSASMLQLLGGDRKVIGVDIDIRAHNRARLEAHPMFPHMVLIQGSSIDEGIAAQVARHAEGRERVMVILDSNHTHEHVAKELALYAPLVTKGCYLVVFDTSIEDAPKELFLDRDWGPGNNPKTAVWEFLKAGDRFELDKEIDTKLLVTVAPDGWLKCVKD